MTITSKEIKVISDQLADSKNRLDSICSALDMWVETTHNITYVLYVYDEYDAETYIELFTDLWEARKRFYELANHYFKEELEKAKIDMENTNMYEDDNIAYWYDYYPSFCTAFYSNHRADEPLDWVMRITSRNGYSEIRMIPIKVNKKYILEHNYKD